MSIAHTAADVLKDHVTLEVECIDRMYLNLYVPMLQTEGGIAHFWKEHRGHRFASSSLMQTMSQTFIQSIDRFAKAEGVPLFTFPNAARKDDIAKEYLAKFDGEEGVLFIGKAQEKAAVTGTEKRHNPTTGQSYAWLVKRTAFVNYYYFYCVDRDFGPFFIKFCSYFPYNGRLCINGHEYAKRQLALKGIQYEALDNGILSCEDPQQLQRLCDGLTDKKIDALARKWFRRLPHPFPAQDRRFGFRYDISILQAEFSLTQVLDRPMSGRILFEEIIRENIDLGRPDRTQLIFDRRVTRRTPGRFRTRVLTKGVVPSVHFDYKNSKIKQYHKEGRALRTETTINNTYDFAIGKKLHNLSSLRKVGFSTNRRLLGVQRISCDATVGEDTFQQLQRPVPTNTGSIAGLRFGDVRVMALLSALLVFRLLPRGFSNRDLREHTAPLLGLPLEQLTQGRMTYDLRRLRYHGLIARIPKSHRYRVTDVGFRTALFLTRSYARLLRPGLAIASPQAPSPSTQLHKAIANVDKAVERIWHSQSVAA